MSDSSPTGSRFDDGKAPDAMRTIGEVSAALGIKPHVLRYWEHQFPVLQPLKRSGGRRLYRVEDIALVERIDRLVNRQGYTLKGANKVLSEGEGRLAAAVEPAAAGGESAIADDERREQSVGSSEVLERLHSISNCLSAALAR